MPFRSRAQQRYLFAVNKALAQRFAAETRDYSSLPDKVTASDPAETKKKPQPKWKPPEEEQEAPTTKEASRPRAAFWAAGVDNARGLREQDILDLDAAEAVIRRNAAEYPTRLRQIGEVASRPAIAAARRNTAFLHRRPEIAAAVDAISTVPVVGGVAEIGVEALTDAIGVAAGGNPDYLERLRRNAQQHPANAFLDKEPPATPLQLPLTPFQASQGAANQSLDREIALHNYYRRQLPQHYWLNPLSASGPISESTARFVRRLNAYQATTDSRAKTILSHFPPMMFAAAAYGNKERQRQLRQAFNDERILERYRRPAEPPVKPDEPPVKPDETPVARDTSAAAPPRTLLAKLRQAKQESDRGNYDAKNRILTDLMKQNPGDWVVDDPAPYHQGVTHRPTGWRFHTARDIAALARGNMHKQGALSLSSLVRMIKSGVVDYTTTADNGTTAQEGGTRIANPFASSPTAGPKSPAPPRPGMTLPIGPYRSTPLPRLQPPRQPGQTGRYNNLAASYDFAPPGSAGKGVTGYKPPASVTNATASGVFPKP